MDHLGVHIDTAAMSVYVSDFKVERVRRLAKKIILLTQLNRSLVLEKLLQNFCGVCFSLFWPSRLLV